MDKKSDSDNGVNEAGNSKQQQMENGLQTENFLAHRSLSHPVQNDRFTKERKHLHDIFPEDVWNLVFKKMDNQDLENVSNSSLYLRSILISSRPVFLFTKVWPFLGQHFDKNGCPWDSVIDSDSDDDGSEICDSDESDSENSGDSDGSSDSENSDSDNSDDSDDSSDSENSDSEESDSDASTIQEGRGRCIPCRRMRTPRWFSEITKLRLVCGTWTKAIDHSYQRLPEPDANKKLDLTANWHCCQFSNIGWDYLMDQFISHFEKTHGNEQRSPFIGKSIKISILRNTSLEPQEFLDQILTILSKYGKYVQYCQIEESEGSTMVESYNRLLQLLEQMPNVVFLGMIFHKANPGAIASELAQLAKLYPLPKLEHLQFLSVNGLYSHVFRELIFSNSHIVKLQMENIDNDFKGYLPSLYNLEELNMSIRHGGELSYFVRRRFGFALTKLSIRFSERDQLDWEKFYAQIRIMWGNTLTDLVVTLPSSLTEGMKAYQRFTGCPFPNVNRLHVTTECHFSLDLVEWMEDAMTYMDKVFPFGGQKEEIKIFHKEMGNRMKYLNGSHTTCGLDDCSVMPKLTNVKCFQFDKDSRCSEENVDVCRWEWKLAAKEDVVRSTAK